MNENQAAKNYYIQLPGYQQGEIWDEDKYNRNKDALFRDHPDAMAFETTPYDGGEIGDNDAYTVHLPGFPEAEIWDASKLARNKERLLADHPDAEITRTTPVNYYGDRLRENYDRVDQLKKELEGLPNDPQVEDMAQDARTIRGGSIAEMQKEYQDRRNSPGMVRRREINRELGQLYREREANPVYKKYWDITKKEVDADLKGIEDLEKRLSEENPEKDQHYRMMRHSVRDAELSDKDYNVTQESLRAAHNLLEDAKKTASAPSRYDSEGNAGRDFWRAVVDGAPNALSIAKLAKAGLNMHLVDAIKKVQQSEPTGAETNILDFVNSETFNNKDYLNEGEKALLKAFVKKAEIEAGRADTISRSYQAGQSAIDSAGFMLDFLLTGGVGGKVADAAVGGLVKAAGRNAAAKIGAESLHGLVKAAVMTPMMPSSYANFMDNLLRINNAGAVDLSGKAMLRAGGDVLIENISETIGSKPLDIIGLPFSKVKFPDWAKALRNAPIMGALKQAGYNGFFEEMTEEWFGNALRVMTGVDKNALKDFATIDQQLVTAGAFAPMSLVGLPVSVAQHYSASKAMSSAQESLQRIIDATNMTDDAKKAALSGINDVETPEDLAHRMTDVYRDIINNGGKDEEAYKAVMEYVRATARYKFVNGVFEEQKDLQRSDRLMELNDRMGSDNWYHEGRNGVSFVRIVTDNDGNERFVVSEHDGQMALIDKDGNKSFLTEDALATDDTLTDSGEQYLNDYLDRQVEAQHKARQAQRAAEQQQQASDEILINAQPGTQVNVGTVENPQTGTIMGVDAGQYVVQMPDGSVRAFTKQEIGNMMGIRTEPVNEEEVEAKEIALEEQRDAMRHSLAAKVGQTFDMGGRQYEFIGVARGRSGMAYDVYVMDEGRATVIPMTDEQMQAVASTMQPRQEAASEQPAQEPVAVDDGIPRDFRGNPLPLRTNKQTGEQVVDGNALWNRDPEAWARWNDTNPKSRVGSKERLEYTIKELDKELEKDAKALQKAALKGTDEDEMDKMESAVAAKQQRRDLLASVLDKYNRPAEAGQTVAGQQRKAAAQQAKEQQQDIFGSIQDKWNGAAKIVGIQDEIRLANGESITGHYVLTEADAPTASHNPADGFKKSEGFPVDENGKTVNDRDYEHDKAAQQSVIEKAANYDQRALQTPVIVSEEGIVLSGNDRTMASQMAAANNTDGAYTEYLSKYSQKYGFTAEQVAQFAHPRVLFVPDQAMPYNAATFAKFNAEEKKSQSKTEKAVKAGKTLSAEALGSIASLVDRYEDINELYNSEDGVNDLLGILLSAEVISQEQVASLKDGKTLSGTGMDLLESTLIGAALDEEAVRIAMSDKSIRKSVVSAISQIITGNTLEGFTLRSEITDAIILLAVGKSAREVKHGESVQLYIRQKHLFQDDVVAEATVQMLADAINDKKTSLLKKVLSLYNRDAQEAANGQMSILTEGVPTREIILRNILEYLGYDTSIIFQTAAGQQQAEGAAEQDQGGQAATADENGSPVQGDQGSSTAQVNREDAYAILSYNDAEVLLDYMTDDEVAELLRLYSEFQPANDALGEAYTRLEKDLKSSDKKAKKAAQDEIDRLDAAQEEAFIPVRDYVQSLVEKYGLQDEMGLQPSDENEEGFEDYEDVEDLEASLMDEEDFDEEEPKPAKKAKKAKGKKSEPKEQPYVVPNAASEEEIAKQTYTQDEWEELVYGYSCFDIFESERTGEQITLYMIDDTHPVYKDHRVIIRRSIQWQDGRISIETSTTTDYLLKYLKANKFKPVDEGEQVSKHYKKPYKNKYGYWRNHFGVVMNPIRIELPSVKKNWSNSSDTYYYQEDNGEWFAGGNASYENGGGSLAVKRGPYKTKSEAIRATIDALVAFRKKHPGKHYNLRDVDNLITTLRTKTLPSALREEGAVSDIHIAEIVPMDTSAAVQGDLFGEGEAAPAETASPAPAESRKPAGKKQSARKKTAKKEETIFEDSEMGAVDEAEDEDMSKYYDQAGEVIVFPGSDDDDKSVTRIGLAERDGKWYASTYVVADGGKGSSFGSSSMRVNTSGLSYPSRQEALKAAIKHIRYILSEPAKQGQNKYGETFNNANELIDFVVKTQLASEKSDKLFDNATAQEQKAVNGLLDPRTMSDSEKERRGNLLQEADVLDVEKDRIVSKEGVSARKAAENWWVKYVGSPLMYSTEAGEVIINLNSVDDSLAHGYSQAKLDAITSLPEGFKNAVYLGSMEDVDRRATMDHYFAYPINYDGKRCYVFCRALHDKNTNRLYVHEVFVADGIKKGNTLQTAASKPHGGIALYRDILANVLQELSSEGKDTDNSEKANNQQENISYGSQNTIITTEKYEELKKRMREKLNNLNAGFDPETFFIGAQMAMYHIEAGARKFNEFARRMISELGDAIRPYLKSFYNGARDLPGMEELKKDMTPAAEVDAIDVDTIGIEEKPQEQPSEQSENEAIQGLGFLTEEDVIALAEEHVNKVASGALTRDGFNGFTPVRMKVIGSRAFGMAREDSDLDILIEYEGSAREDAVFNLLNEEHLKIAGITVDFFPIRAQESGTMDEWLASHNDGRPVEKEEAKAEQAEKPQATVRQVDVNGLFNAVSDMYAGKRSQVKLSEFSTPVEEEKQEEEQPASEVESDTIGEIGKYTHTKTGKEMSIVRLTGDRISSDEFKALKARAKELGGYYSSFAGAKGFLFDNEEDAIKFNTINTNENEEQTDEQTAADTTALNIQAEALASEAEALAQSESIDEQKAGELISNIDQAVEDINDQLALLGFYEADTSSKFDEQYGYSKSAEKKVVKDADKLAKRLAADLGIAVKGKLATANIAPAGGEVYFRIPLENGREMYVCIYIQHEEYGSDNLVVEGYGRTGFDIMYRIESPASSGLDKYGTNHFVSRDVTYSDLLDGIRTIAKNYLPEKAGEKAEIGVPDLLKQAEEIAKKNRKEEKKSVSSQADGDSMLGDLFNDMSQHEEPAIDDTLPFVPATPTEVNGYKIGDKVIYTTYNGKEEEATIEDFERDGRPVLDTGMAPVMYEVVDWENIKPINNNEDGLQGVYESRSEGTGADSNRPLGDNQGTEGEGSQEAGQESGGSDTGREGAGRLDTGSGRSLRRVPRLNGQNKRNNHVSRGEIVYPTTPTARYNANVNAIKLLKELQNSDKPATKEQMAVLRQYTGWGGLGSFFNDTRSASYKELKDLLTEEELQSAIMSINTAYYTPTEIIDVMWDVVKNLGFEGGNILEGSAGIGNILASMPNSISDHSSITAVEIDGITGGILRLLYPDANVMVKGFQDADIRNGSVDLAITNVPFGDILMYDSKEKDLSNKFGSKIHDFCIAKNIRKLSEGGIGVFITTRGTLDSGRKALRQWIVNEGNADVIGAFRMNNQTFGGAKVTSDIIVVRKRVAGRKVEGAIDITDTSIARRAEYSVDSEWDRKKREWVDKVETAVMEVNNYFIEHPENMGGEMGFNFEHKDTYRPEGSALWPSEDIDQGKRLSKWAKQFSSMKMDAPAAEQSENKEALEQTGVKEGQLVTNKKGEICVSRTGLAVPIGVNKQKIKGKYTKAQALADYDTIKTAINKLLDYQLKNESDSGLDALIKDLNKAYDTFVMRYGTLNKNVSISFLRNDVDFAATAAIEDYREKKDMSGKVTADVKKTNIFKQRILGAKRVVTPSSVKDGVIVSMNQYGRIDIPFIAKALNKDEEDVIKEVLSSGLCFENPRTLEIEVNYEYLSGNVREKLEYAREHNDDGRFDKNIDALEKVIPADIPSHLIEFSLGSDWIPKELYTMYAMEKFGVNKKFEVSIVGGTWVLSDRDWEFNVNNEQNIAAGVMSDKLRMTIPGHKLMIAAMNNASVQFSKSHKDSLTGQTVTEYDKEATQAANTKISEMREDFKEWAKAKMLSETELSDRIGRTYNMTFNAVVPKEISDTFIPEHFDGQVLSMKKDEPFSLYKHQSKAVIRATTEPVMLAHEVGAGKTFTLITAAMEMRRLGTAKKPMIVVQNSTLGQFVTSAKELYPNAKVLTISESDRTFEGRTAFYAKIKYNDWDIIIVPQSVFEMIPDSEDRKRAYIQEKIDEKVAVLEQARMAKNSNAVSSLQKEIDDLRYEYLHGEKPTKKRDAKKEEAAKENAATRAKKQLDRRTDDVSDFDDMGIDALLIDEAQAYKHLGFSTAMTRGVKGIDPSGSKKSAGVYLKTRSVFDKAGWKNVVFATGTPISNTAAEIWTFIKYLMQPEDMKKYHIYYFDDFVRNFGNISTNLEFNTSGKFKENNRFASYTNLPELVRIWSSVSDTVLAREAVAAGGEKLEDKQPKMENWTDKDGVEHINQARDIYLPQSPSLVDIMKAVRAKLEWYEGLSGKEKRENSSVPLVMYGIAKMAAIDPRLVDKNAADEPYSKTNKVVEETLKALDDSKKYNGTCALFCDNFRRWDYNEDGKRIEGFNVFEEIKRKLVEAGVPENQIVIISNQSVAAKEKIFEKVNSGEIRVIMGSTSKLGTGVNIQERLFMAAHIDAPNRPMDYTQRNGRILRQGNLHKEWGIPVRVIRFGVEDSLDVTAYQRLSTKAKFIDSVMNGRPLIANGMENRVLEEEEEGLFDNPVAILSGSQYAMLKSQAERELRKLRNKKEQHRQDQIYIERKLKNNASLLEYYKKSIKSYESVLEKVRNAFPGGSVDEITIEGVKAKGAEQISNVIKDKIVNPIKEKLERWRNDYRFESKDEFFTMNFNGIPVTIKVFVQRKSEYDYKTSEFRTKMSTTIDYSCKDFEIEDRPISGGYSNVKDVIDDFAGSIASGRYFEEQISRFSNNVSRIENDNDVLLSRRGKPFTDEDKLKKQEEVVADLTEKMKEEMKVKEEKYAQMAKESPSNFNLDSVSTEEDDEGEGETHYSEAEEGAPRLNVDDLLVRAEAVAVASRAASFLGLKIEIVSDKSSDKKGAYQEGQDHIVLNIAACESIDDIVSVVLHEGVAHFGLRKLIERHGRTMGDFLDEILRDAAPSIKRKINELAEKKGWSMEYAAEEYIADLAENEVSYMTKPERNFWRKVVEWFRNALSKIFGVRVHIHDEQIRELLRQSYENLLYDISDETLKIASDIVSSLDKQYNSISKINPVEKITSKSDGYYDPVNDTINIFASNKNTPDDYRKVFFHENLHAFFRKNSIGEDFFKSFLEAVRTNELYFNKVQFDKYLRAIKDIGEYDGKLNASVEEEHTCRVLANILANGKYFKTRDVLPADVAIIIDEFTNKIGYEPLHEFNLANTRRFRRRLADYWNATGINTQDGSFEDALDGEGEIHYSVRTKPAPQKTGIGYKVFYRGKDGKLYPPMVANPDGKDTPVGVWLDADAAPVAGQSKTGRPQVKAGGAGTQGGSGTLAYRPGWHLGEIPYALQFNRLNPETGQKELFPRDFVWAEVEYSADNDYQQEADAEGMTDNGKYRHSYAGLKHIPEDGFYRYRTNPNPETDPWIITGAMKVNRVLTDEEVDEMVRAAGREPQLREGDIVRNRVAYHGSAAEFDRFDRGFIGTGEGSQAYGYGIYVSGVKETGRMYAGIAVVNNDNNPVNTNAYSGDMSNLNWRIEQNNKEIERLRRKLADEDINDILTDEDKERLEHRIEFIQNMNKQLQASLDKMSAKYNEFRQWRDKILDHEHDLEDKENSPRHLYTVEIPDDTGENYLSWDEDLTDSQLQKIIDAAQKSGYKEETRDDIIETINKIIHDNGFGSHKMPRDGGSISEMLSYQLEGYRSSKMASNLLHRAGFVGMKVETGHQAGGDGRGWNYVIYNEKDINITNHERFRYADEEWLNSNNGNTVEYTNSISERKEAAIKAAQTAGIDIEFKPSSEMMFKGKPLTGQWKNGKIYLCLEHCRDNDDAIRTILHEGVGHNGLRRLLGNENMTDFCLDLYRRLPNDVRAVIAKNAVNKYGGSTSEAVEEYLAERAEEMDLSVSHNLWDIVVEALRNALRRIGFDIPFSDRDVRWIMWQSYNANKRSDMINEVKRNVIANRLGFSLTQQAEKGEGVQIARNRLAQDDLAPAAHIYNRDVLYWRNRLHETWVDKDNAVHILVDAIEKSTRKKAQAFEDIRLSLNQQSSKGLAAIENFESNYYNPMKEAILSLMKSKGCSLADVERYVMLKHGLERNEVFAKRDARQYYQDIHDAAVKAYTDSETLDQADKDFFIAKEDAKLEKHFKAIEAGTDSKYKELRQQDYGGLTALYSEFDNTEPNKQDWETQEEYNARMRAARHPKYTTEDENGHTVVDMKATEEATSKEIDDFEKGFEDGIDELWKRINAATKFTIKHQYNANMMSREQYMNVKDMFKYYVPLRGFKEDTAEDLYDYYTTDRRNAFTPPLVKAKGRKTEAESPFGYIGAMASSGIAADMKNETKLSLYYFVSNRPSNDLVSISEVWYEKNGEDEEGRQIFVPVYPKFDDDLGRDEAKQAFEQWENSMKEKAKSGLAFKGRRKLDLHNAVIHIDKRQESSHVIPFKVGGRDMMMFVNGNPRAAQSINNELNVEMSKDYQKVFGRILRYFSGINTSYNPEFWLSNAQRDTLFALMNVNIKEDGQYNKAFRKNLGRLLRNTLTPGAKGGVYSLKRRLDSGKLGDSRLEELYNEFVENGGVTGYTTLKNNEEWELELRKYTGDEKKAMQAVKKGFEAVQHFGEAIEQMTRFAAYITSREQGKQVKEAVADAKELTVNFNRKGSGQAISFKDADRLRTKDGKKLTPLQKAFVVGASWLPVYGRRFIIFFNASVQGLNTMYNLFKKNPAKTGYWAAGFFALGVMQAIIHNMLDDDDDYLDIPDYERRNNLLLGADGVYFKWALPQECRVFYGLGDMMVNHALGREPDKNIVGEFLASASDIAPLNPSGGISALSPSALAPVVEVALNRDYKGAKIFNDLRYLSEEERKRTPGYTRAYSGTGKGYILLSEFANSITGGDYTDAGWLNINPAAVEHILQGATGGVGTTIGKLYRGTVGQALGEDFTVRNTPFLSRLLTVTDDRYRNAHTTDLFNYYKAEAEHTKKRINTYRRNGDSDKLDELIESRKYEVMRIYDSYRHTLEWYNDELKVTTDSKERKALMREQDAVRKEMILEISNIDSDD